MTSDATRRALDQASRKAGLGKPYSAPSNATQNTLAAMRSKVGLPPASPSPRDLAAGDASGEFGHHIVEPVPARGALDHRARGEQGRKHDAELRRRELARHGQLSRLSEQQRR